MSSEWSLAHSEGSPSFESSPFSSSPFNSLDEPNSGWSSWGQMDDESLPSPEQRNRDAVIFLLDCTSPMLSLSSSSQGEAGQGKTHWDVAISLCSLFVKQKVIQSPDDLIGVLLMGTTLLHTNAHSHPHIHQYLPLSPPSAEMIRAINALSSSDTLQSIGMGEERDINLRDAFWSCQSMFQTAGGSRKGGGGASSSTTSLSHNAHKRIFVWTSNAHPFNDAQDKAQALHKVRDLRDQEVELKVFRLHRADVKFNMAIFWRQALIYSDDEGGMERMEGNVDEVEDSFSELREKLFRRVSKKRALGSVGLQLTPSLSVGVKLYCLYLEAKKDPPVLLSKQSNVKLTAETKAYDTATGETLAKHEIRRYYPFGGVKAHITDDELKQIKTVGEAGLVLLGFKAATSIKAYHNLRSPYFIYPDEGGIKGSTRAFHALLLGMAELGVVGVARLIYRTGTMPRMVALLPQLAVADVKGINDRPPGMHLVFLPYADDIRQLEVAPAAPVDEAVKVQAKRIIRALRIPGYQPSDISNPALQKHYAGIQAMALHEAQEELLDELQPDVEGMQKNAPLFEAFNAAIFTEAEGEEVGEKRKGGGGRGGGGGGGGKRVKKEGVSDEEYNAIDWEGMKESGEGWKKLTINHLKIYLRRHNLPLGGRKDELILRIESHQPI